MEFLQNHLPPTRWLGGVIKEIEQKYPFVLKWPAFSCDLNVCDFSVWFQLKYWIHNYHCDRDIPFEKETIKKCVDDFFADFVKMDENGSSKATRAILGKGKNF